MAKELIVSVLAQQDLDAIWNYYSERNLEEVGSRLIREIGKKFSLFLQYPEIGRERNDLILYLRSFAIKDYLIFYLPSTDAIEIFRVVKGSRNISKLFDEMVGQ
jgi:toxin ParE1/3/4